MVVLTPDKFMDAINLTNDPAFKYIIPMTRNKFMYLNQIRANKRKLLVMCQQRLLSMPTIILTPKNSIFVDILSQVIIELKSAGLVTFWLSEDVNEKFKYSNDESTPRRLDFYHLSGGFYFLGIGLIFGFLAFLGENFRHKIWRK